MKKCKSFMYVVYPLVADIATGKSFTFAQRNAKIIVKITKELL